MNDYKIFSESEFNKRVEMFWNLMVKPEFPDWNCVKIDHDRAKRRTNNLGMSHSKWRNGVQIPSRLSFSYRMLDGRFNIEDVDDTIKHEIGHSLDVLRNGRSSGHGANFKKIAKEFDFNDGTIFKQIRQSEISDLIINAEYKYYFVCEHCGKAYKHKRKNKDISYIMKIGHMVKFFSCGKCKHDAFTLYHFPKGIEAGTEVDYEAYYNMFGGIKIS